MKNIQDFKIINNKQAPSILVGKIKVKFLIAMSILITSLVSTQLIFASNLAVDGHKLTKVEEEIRMLETQNTALRVEISRISSLSTLSEKAQELGYQTSSSSINVSP